MVRLFALFEYKGSNDETIRLPCIKPDLVKHHCRAPLYNYAQSSSSRDASKINARLESTLLDVFPAPPHRCLSFSLICRVYLMLKAQLGSVFLLDGYSDQ